MQSKHFIGTLIGVFVIGCCAGGLAGMLNFGDAKETSTLVTEATDEDGSGGPPGDGRTGNFDPNRIREQIRSGELDPRDLAALRDRLQGNGSVGGRTGREATEEVTDSAVAKHQTGTVRTVSAESIVIDTGVMEVTIGVSDDTPVQSFVAAAVEDLAVGQDTLFIGQPGAQGIAARFLIATPQGSGALESVRASFSGGFGTGRTRGAFSSGIAANLLTGSIKTIGGNTITVETDRGSLTVLIDPQSTTLQILTAASVDSLKADQRVVVTLGATGSADAIVATPNLRSLIGSIFGRSGSRQDNG